ncbi:FACT complex subunit SSRP1-like [Solanum tuberosum]|uniref:High mobility group protein 2 HMG2 n=1 Tax=Solanum tuberosum TaxID=4113 RepID=M1B056_SOLTU|nr:PREDICTED: FACT complex subunit SSRP1-like [Solanum tuberosum]
MPAAFVKEHKKMLAKTALLKTDEGMICKAKMVRNASDYLIGEGDWPLFVLHHKLEVGNMLIFFLINKSTFQVLLYSKKCLTNIRHFEEFSSSEDEVENINEASTRSKKVKMEAVQLSEKRVDPSGGSKDGGNPCYSHLGKSDAKSSETNKANGVNMETVILSDFEEERVDPSSGSEDGGNPGGQSDAKANNMLGLKKKALETNEAKEAAKDPDKPKSPARAFHVKRGWRSDKNPNKPKRPAGAFFIFLNDFRKQFKEENPNNKSKVPIHIAGGEKWKQLSDAEKAPYIAETRKCLDDYLKKKDAYKK